MQANLSNSGGFANATLLTVPGASIVVSGDSADLDGDGVREIVGTPIANGVPPTAFIIVLRPNGSGGLAASWIPLSGSYHNFGYDICASSTSMPTDASTSSAAWKTPIS